MLVFLERLRCCTIVCLFRLTISVICYCSDMMRLAYNTPGEVGSRATSARVLKPPPERSEYNENFSDRFRLMEDRMRWLTRSYGRRRRIFMGMIRLPDKEDDEDGPSRQDNALPIKSVDLMRDQNGRDHFTDQYETLNLVVRRGQQFGVTLNLNRPLDKEERIHLKLWTDIDDEPALGPADTKIVLRKPGVLPKRGEWSFTLEDTTSEQIELKIKPPNNAIICRWRLQVKIVTKQRKQVQSFNADKEIYMIFNPWDIMDGACMDSEDERQEYVMNEEGGIFVGSSYWPSLRKWDFGQFESPVLEAAMRLLDKSQLKPSARRSPIFISRTISALVNAPDNGGVLVGNWSGDYSGGTPPTAWTGSVAVLEQFMHTGKPVSYGQCWVFSAITTSLMRALGIACRSVTNFDSAHDTDANLCHDVLFDENMDRLDHDDSVWNFHVWNEVYMRRPDLPTGYDGWQAIDGTPQETSDGVYQCGPTSLQAVREGTVYLPYDTRFVFAEVNADEVHWQYENQAWRVIKVVSDSVGSAVLTKAVGSNGKHDVTDLYKSKEGTEEERFTAKLAVTFGRNPHVHRVHEEKTMVNDITAEIVAPQYVDLIADDFAFSVQLTNLSPGEKRTVKNRIIVKKVQYTGVTKNVLLKKVVELAFEEEASKCDLAVNLKDQLVSANDDASLKIQVLSTVEETGQIVSSQLAIPLILPEIVISVDDESPRRGQTVQVHLKIPNPFKIKLTMAFFELAGAGLEKPRKLNIGTVKPNQVAGTSTFVVPKRKGTRGLFATFSCKQFQGARGFKEIKVEK